MTDFYDEDGARVHNVFGGDWDSVRAAADGQQERLVVNMGPQHPSTHGVLRLVVELEGETVKETRLVTGYLHTGIEKQTEYRNFVQGTTLVTRMDYMQSIFTETAYCLAIEKLLGITDQIPERANVIRVMMMELTRINSHLVCLATGGLELGALTGMTAGFRDREIVLDLFEYITGLRMNHAYIRPGGVAQDLPQGAEEKIRESVALMRERFKDTVDLLVDNSIWMARTKDVGYLDLTGCVALGMTGPVLRSTGYGWDLRKTQPYCGYETYEFDVPTQTGCDAYSRFLIRIAEMEESLKIVEQCLDRLRPGPVMVEDKKIAWPAQLAIAGDGQGNSLEHIKEIMGESMESLIHHFKLVTEGFEVPAGQVYVAVEAPKGELGCFLASDGGTRPYRVHFRDPSFNNLQAVPAMSEGGLIADLIAVVASVDPVLGGVDR